MVEFYNSYLVQKYVALTDEELELAEQRISNKIQSLREQKYSQFQTRQCVFKELTSGYANIREFGLLQAITNDQLNKNWELLISMQEIDRKQKNNATWNKHLKLADWLKK